MILRQHPDARQILVFPPSLDWHMQLFQRPQQLALAFARLGALVFYLQPTASYNRSWRASPGRESPIRGQQSTVGNQQKIDLGTARFERVTDHRGTVVPLYLCHVPLETFGIVAEVCQRDPILYVLTWNRKYIRSLAHKVAEEYRSFDQRRSSMQAPFIYDFVDEIETFYGNPARMARDHERMVRSATLVVTTAERLYKQVLPLRPDALLCPNGVDIELFQSTDTRTMELQQEYPPADLAPILAKGKPIVGYYGALARWFNYDLLKRLACRRADLSFVLIGPDYDRTLLPSKLLQIENVYWLGLKPYIQMPIYLRYFDVAIIPFKLNEITHSTSPLKLFEYQAGGKPVVITAMQESMRYQGILVAMNLEEFSLKIDLGLQLRFDPHYPKQIEEIARQNTWNVRASQILDALDAKSR